VVVATDALLRVILWCITTGANLPGHLRTCRVTASAVISAVFIFAQFAIIRRPQLKKFILLSLVLALWSGAWTVIRLSHVCNSRPLMLARVIA